jgi:hypothetical protein
MSIETGIKDFGIPAAPKYSIAESNGVTPWTHNIHSQNDGRVCTVTYLLPHFHRVFTGLKGVTRWVWELATI